LCIEQLPAVIAFTINPQPETLNSKPDSLQVETMMEQLSQGITALDKRGADLSAYAAESKRGIKDVQASHMAKIQQIKQHAASLRAVLDKKEAASIQVHTNPWTTISAPDRQR
jgi:hypothetical protein